MTRTRSHVPVKGTLACGIAAYLLTSMLAAKEPGNRTNPITWSAKLRLQSLAAIPQRLNQPFDDRFDGQVHGKPATIASCTDYLRLSPEAFKLSNETESGILQSYAVDCVALDMLRRATPARTNFIGAFPLTADSLSMLPPELAPAVSHEQQAAASAANAAGKSWAAFQPGATAKTVDENQIVVTQGDWQVKITEYACGDFDGDGFQDLLVRADYAATRGTYGNTKLFLLGRKRAAERLRCEKKITIR
jgi:FG-GAP repeat